MVDTKLLTEQVSLVGSMSALYASCHINPCPQHILLWKNFPLSLIQEEQVVTCQLPAKEWAQNTGKLPIGGLPRNSGVKYGPSEHGLCCLPWTQSIKQTNKNC